ncbi:MAG: hypothetical protein QJR03_02585 [Sphaerobacter sp.]|nr:hypothetical protein [Sphaerobacter sp.]
MTPERTQATLARVVEIIQRDLTAADLGLPEPVFQRLSENIGRAILHAVAAHVSDEHRPEADYGELERPGA